MNAAPSSSGDSRSTGPTPQEVYVRGLARSLVAANERPLRAAVVTRPVEADGQVGPAEADRQAGLYFAIWTTHRLLLVRTRRNQETGAPKRAQLGLESVSRDRIRAIRQQSASGAGRLLLDLDDSTTITLDIDFDEPSVSGQRRFFESVASASGQPASGQSESGQSESGNSESGHGAASSSGAGAGDPDVVLAVLDEREGVRAPIEVGALAAGQAAGGVGAERLAAALSLEDELARAEGLLPGAVVMPAEPPLPTLLVSSPLPPVVRTPTVRGPGGDWESVAPSYPLMANEQPSSGRSPLPPPKAREGRASGLPWAIVGLVVAGCVGLSVLAACGGLLLMLGRAGSARSQVTRPVAVPSLRSGPPVYRPPVFEPPVSRPPVFEPPVYRPPVFEPPTFEPPGAPGLPGSSLDPGAAAREAVERMRREHESRMRERDEMLRSQRESMRRQHEELLQRMRPGTP